MMGDSIEIPHMKEIVESLTKYAPRCPNDVSLLHGDFKVDNHEDYSIQEELNQQYQKLINK